jgi:hypothetical protein
MEAVSLGSLACPCARFLFLLPLSRPLLSRPPPAAAHRAVLCMLLILCFSWAVVLGGWPSVVVAWCCCLLVGFVSWVVLDGYTTVWLQCQDVVVASLVDQQKQAVNVVVQAHSPGRTLMRDA